MTEAQTITTTVKLKGQQLLDYVNDVNLTNTTRTEMILGAGYVNANGTAAYVDYYTELLKAKEMLDPTYVSQQEAEDAEYDDLTGTQQDLYDEVHSKFGEKWDHEDIMGFMKELDDIGIETPEQLNESYEWETDEYRAEESFAEYFVTEVLCTGIPDILEGCVDWRRVWDSALTYDYNTIEYDSSTYFFRNM